MLTDKEITILNRVDADEAYSNWFFGRAKHLKWFFPLKEKGYFLTSKIQYEGKNALYWRTLPYLERISEQAKEIQNRQYGIELIAIIKEFIDFEVSGSNKSINNPFIWRSFVSILINIPNDIIHQHFQLSESNGFIKMLEICSAGDSMGVLARDISGSLLKKFLHEDSMLQYAEAIVDSITDIKPGTRKRAVSDRNEASLKYESYWVMEAFQKNADEIGKRSEKAITIVADKLKRTLEYDQLSSSCNIILGDNVYEITSTRSLTDKTDKEKIEFERDVYLLDVKQYSAKQLDGKNITQGLWGLIGVDPEMTILPPVRFVAYTKNEFEAEVKQLLPSSIDWDSFPQLKDRLSQLYEGLFEDYSQVWFKSLAGGDRLHIHSAREGLTIVLRDLIDARGKISPDKCRNILKSFLSPNYPFPLFKKFALFFVDKFWSIGFDTLFNEFLEKVPAVLGTEAYEVELHKIFRNHNAVFPQELKEKIRLLINEVPDYYLEHGEKYVSYWKYKWLSPLKENQDFKEAFVEAKANSEVKTDENGYSPEEHPFKGGIIHHQSALSKEEVRKKHHDGSLVAEFNKFEKSDLRKAFNNEPDREGLGDAFQQEVTRDPDFFIGKIDQYKNSPPFFVHRLLWGLREAHKNKKSLSWNKIIDFSEMYLSSHKKLLSDATETEDGDTLRDEYLWCVSNAANLIEDASNDNTVKSEHFAKINSFFDAISSIFPDNKGSEYQGEAIHYALNTPLGKVIRANISFGLRVARNSKDKNQPMEANWGSREYERYFDKGIESYIWFGHYFPHLRLLDKNYAESKLKDLSQYDITDHAWQAFMNGYLISSALYDDIYALPSMRINYEKAIESNAFGKNEDTSLAQHITTAYLRGHETLLANNADGKPSLFWKMLHNNSTERTKRWLATANFFWSISPRTLDKDIREQAADEMLKHKMVDRIIDFWRWTYNNNNEVEKLLQSEYHQFLARLADLTIYLDKIDDEKEPWLLLVAPHCNLHHMSSFFIEYLTQFLENEDSAKRIGKIYLKILEGTTPDFNEDHIREIVKRLYELAGKYPDTKVVADKICNTYAERNNYFLKDLYAKNQLRSNG